MTAARRRPTLDGLWQLAADAGVTCFGTSAAFIAACQKAGIAPAGGGRDLSALRSVGSTGSPLAAEGFRWIYDELDDDTWLFSMSGGTDVCTAFVGGVPLLPVHEGELQARSLGCDVQAFDEHGRALTDAVGELVRHRADALDAALLLERPWRRAPARGVFRHLSGRLAPRRLDRDHRHAGTAIIYGRSDSTINRGGVRMGTSEIYRAVLRVDEVLDALVVDVDGWLALFVVLREGAGLDDALRDADRAARALGLLAAPRPR